MFLQDYLHALSLLWEDNLLNEIISDTTLQPPSAIIHYYSFIQSKQDTNSNFCSLINFPPILFHWRNIFVINLIECWRNSHICPHTRYQTTLPLHAILCLGLNELIIHDSSPPKTWGESRTFVYSVQPLSKTGCRLISVRPSSLWDSFSPSCPGVYTFAFHLSTYWWIGSRVPNFICPY
jgi:hypothetical protein